MKRILIILLPFVFSGGGANSQNTWVQKLTYNVQSQGYIDTVTGVKQIEVGQDGSIYVLANIHAHGAQKIYKFFPNSHQPEWMIDAGYNFAQGPQWTDRFRTTSDSGIITCYNWKWSLDPIYGWVNKYDKNGTLEWSTIFPIWDWNSGSDRPVSDVIEKSPGKYDVLVRDSMYTLDAVGNVIDSNGAVNGTRLMQMTNGDLLVFSGSNMLFREDTLGNILWSQPCNGQFAYDTASVFIVHSNSFVKKVDALTGNQHWNRDYGHSPISEILGTNGGFIASVGYKPLGLYNWGYGVPSTGYLIAADSLGDTLWTRPYSLPHYGLSAFNIVPGGNILTGGCYLTDNALGPYKDHSAFICMMNSDGSYPLAQTDYMVPSDADHNYNRNFVDDILATMLALGQTGQYRDTSIDSIGATCDRNDIAIDWPNASASGVNYKYSDYDGNGIVDTNDVNNFIYCYPDSMQLYYRLGNVDHNQSIEEFSLTPVNDTILPGDDAIYYIVMGNTGNPVDSIYGFAFSYFISEWGWDQADSAAFYSTGLGVPGLNVWTMHQNAFVTFNMLIRTHTLMCRTDFQNAISVNDTLGLIRFRGYFPSSPFTPTIADFKAILVDGTEVPFNLSAGSIFIDSSSVSISEKEKIEVKISPNPVAEKLSVTCYQLSGTSIQISILNSLGEKVKELKSTETITKIPVEDLPNGFYFGSIICENAIKNFSFVVQH